MLGAIAALVIGLVILGFAADQLVVGAARVALALRMSAILVGAVIIGFGTSAPELLITALAGVEDAADVAAGNLVGSNIANLAVVAAITALVAPLVVSSQTLRREIPLSVGAVLGFALVLQGGLSRGEGIALLALFALAAAWIIRGAVTDEDPLGLAASDVAGDGRPLRWEVARTIGGLLGTLLGAQLVVSGAQDLALELGIREGFVGLTLVALGTSLPELVTGVQAARRGHLDLIVGNVLGSNVFNSLLAGGILALVAPGPFGDPDIAGLAAWLMVATAIVGAVLFGTQRRLARWEAGALLLAYCAMLPFLAR
ncbi:MAG TPA: sodium:calcium antiporter [Solirubrobacterales bacterium]|nr:sodium:calcium antiporter [Solirubrobacterales bacterium]